MFLSCWCQHRVPWGAGGTSFGHVSFKKKLATPLFEQTLFWCLFHLGVLSPTWNLAWSVAPSLPGLMFDPPNSCQICELVSPENSSLQSIFQFLMNLRGFSKSLSNPSCCSRAFLWPLFSLILFARKRSCFPQAPLAYLSSWTAPNITLGAMLRMRPREPSCTYAREGRITQVQRQVQGSGKIFISLCLWNTA